MAGIAGCGCRLVKEHQVAANGLPEGVASRAGDILMAALERECRLLVIEKRRLPLVAVVAGGAVAAARPKLVSVGVLVALAASDRSALELNVQQGEFHVRRLVAIDAGHGTMRALQREFRPLVVEFRQIFPFLG